MMKVMSFITKKTGLMVVAICVFALTRSVSAGPTMIADVPASDLGGLGDPMILEWLNTDPYDSPDGVIDLWNSSNEPNLPFAGLKDTENSDDSVGGDFKQYELSTGGWDYLVLHWGGAKGEPGGRIQAWWIGDEPIGSTHLFETYAAESGRQGGALSFYRYYGEGLPPNQVPDSGSGLLFLGACLTMLEGFRRRIAR